jgi:rhamnose utilization protein RhaD (predicted bifunctional aldolase and dehydrogenase)
MKIPALLTAAALACGSAFAAGQYGSGSADSATQRSQSTAVSSDSASKSAKGDGVVAKTKRALHRMGDKMRSVGRKSTDNDEINQAAARHDTRSMGAAGSETPDSARQRRMDDAYANWKSKQKSSG